jgi:hypothetical protein
VIGLVGALGLGIIYRPFLQQLPAAFRRRFMVAGAVYLGGAIVLDVVGGLYWSLMHPTNQFYVLIPVAEETMELLGAGMFLLALLDYVRSHHRLGTALDRALP